MQSDIMILDGAWGTLLQKHGMPASACPERWALDHPELVKRIGKAYADAGAQAVLAPTFGASPMRLRTYGLEGEYESINQGLVQLLRQALPKGLLLGGSMGPGQYLGAASRIQHSSLDSAPTAHSSMTFEDAVLNYATQAQALCEAGVDYFHLETMTDLNEARAGMVGIRQVCKLPVYVSMYFREETCTPPTTSAQSKSDLPAARTPADSASLAMRTPEDSASKMRTPAGDSPACCAIVLEALGAEAVGVNCGSAPASLAGAVAEMARYARKPVIAKASAGLPGNILDPEDFAAQMLALAGAGARYLGGCCGSGPEHIHAIRRRARGLRFLPRSESKEWMLCSRNRFLPFANALIIGNLRVASNSRFLARIRNGEYHAVRGEIDIMGEAQMLCINAVAEGLDEVSALKGIAQEAWAHSDLPMAFRPQRPAALEGALREYPGRALVILDCVAEKDRRKVQEIASRYGALCMV